MLARKIQRAISHTEYRRNGVVWWIQNVRVCVGFDAVGGITGDKIGSKRPHCGGQLLARRVRRGPIYSLPGFTSKNFGDPVKWQLLQKNRCSMFLMVMYNIIVCACGVILDVRVCCSYYVKKGTRGAGPKCMSQRDACRLREYKKKT